MALKLAAGLTLYFCRHGETVANVETRYQGRTIDTALTPRGRKQARRIAKILQHRVDDVGELKFVCSPLQRARTTMEIVRTHLNLPPKGYAVSNRLQEIDLGRWDGLTHGQARALDPAMYDRRIHDKWNVRVPGGENYADVAKRATRWLNGLKGDTFAVTHGGFTRILRGLFAELSAQEISDLDEPQGVLFRVRGSTVKKFKDA